MYLDIDTFQTLAAIVDAGSFAKAADRLNRSQSAVSYKIKRLEEFLGAPVFDRSAYRATLTDSGRAILQEGNKLLQQMRHIEGLAQQHQSGWEPRIDLIMDGALPMPPLLRALKTLEQEEVPTVIQLRVEHLGGVQDRFEQSDARIMLAKDFKPAPTLSSEPLPDVTNVLVVSRHHPLAAMSQVAQEQLHGFVELTVRDSSQQEQSASVTGNPLFGGDRVYFLSDFQQKKQALLMGLGFGWMPSYLIGEELVSGELVTVDLAGQNCFNFTPQLVWRNGSENGRATQRLLTLIREQYANP